MERHGEDEERAREAIAEMHAASVGAHVSGNGNASNPRIARAKDRDAVFKACAEVLASKGAINHREVREMAGCASASATEWIQAWEAAMTCRVVPGVVDRKLGLDLLASLGRIVAEVRMAMDLAYADRLKGAAARAAEDEEAHERERAAHGTTQAKLKQALADIENAREAVRREVARRQEVEAVLQRSNEEREAERTAKVAAEKVAHDLELKLAKADAEHKSRESAALLAARAREDALRDELERYRAMSAAAPPGNGTATLFPSNEPRAETDLEIVSGSIEANHGE